VWPYLETFSEDVSNEITAELKGQADLIIGNYSDGNSVASSIAHKQGITQSNKSMHMIQVAVYPGSQGQSIQLSRNTGTMYRWQSSPVFQQKIKCTGGIFGSIFQPSRFLALIITLKSVRYSCSCQDSI